MEQRSSGISKWLLLGLAALLFFQFGLPLITGKGKIDRQPLGDIQDSLAQVERAPDDRCEIEGDRFRAVLGTRGASLRSYQLSDTKRYAAKAPMPDGIWAGIVSTFSPTFGKPIGPLELVTTTRESRDPLRTDLRLPNEQSAQVSFDDVDYKIVSRTPKSCVFQYEERKFNRLTAALAVEKDDAKREEIKKQIEEAKKNEAEQAVVTRVTKTVSATGNPYELSVELKVENLGAEARKHRLTIEQSAWLYQKQTAGSLGRKSDWATDTVVGTTSKTERFTTDKFRPSDFTDKEFTAEKWRRAEGDGKWAAVSSSYMAGIVLNVEAPAPPAAEAQIEEYWNSSAYADKSKDPDFSHVYRARLAYPEKELRQGESATYKIISFQGPKERALLEKLGQGTIEVIDPGSFSITFIVKSLIWYLYLLFNNVTHSWGWAIVIMTITVRLVLFPLSITQIKSTAVMRRLKPEIDALNEKHKDDTTQKGLALQELYRKNGVNPVIGCLPMLLQMPVWFALYGSLQSAVELYNVPFGPFIPDLSSPGKYFIIPAVLGLSSFTQQKIMPMQGDPAQQKMMLYMMPTIFTVMMLFLPAGLGVYMLTNTWLGILQQVLVERYLRNRTGASGTGIVVKEKDTGNKTKGDRDDRRQLLERGKARG